MADAGKEGEWGSQATLSPFFLILVRIHPHFLFRGFFAVSAEHVYTELAKARETKEENDTEAWKRESNGNRDRKSQTWTFEVV